MAHFFGDNTSFTAYSIVDPSIHRSFSSFSDAAAEASHSRIYGGIHFNAAAKDGLSSGRALANRIVRTHLQKRSAFPVFPRPSFSPKPQPTFSPAPTATPTPTPTPAASPTPTPSPSPSPAINPDLWSSQIHFQPNFPVISPPRTNSWSWFRERPF